MLGYTPRPALCACTWSFSVMHATHARAEDSSEKSSDHLSAIASHDLLVGRRVRVFWASDKTWYSGSLGEYSVSSGKHLCQYDDGETEWLNLGREKYELDEGTGIACPSHGHAPGAPCSSIGPVCFQTCRSCIAVHDGIIRTQVLHALRSHYMSTKPARLAHCMVCMKLHGFGLWRYRTSKQSSRCNGGVALFSLGLRSQLSVSTCCTGPAPRKLSFGGKRQAANKKRLVLDDSEGEDADMADADSGEESGSVFDAQEEDASSSEDEDEGDSATDASDKVPLHTSALHHLLAALLSALEASSVLLHVSWHRTLSLPVTACVPYKAM